MPDKDRDTDILDGDYQVLASDEADTDDDSGEGDEEEDGDGSGDRAALALDVPEPAQAMAANAALAKGGKDKGKGKKGLKGKAKGDKAGIDVVIDDGMIGPEDEAKEDVEAEAAQDISAYDSDEITDPELDDVDPLMMLLGANEKPWEKEKLSVVERMMMNPGYERDTDALRRDQDGEDPKARDKATKVGKVAALAAGAAALGVAAVKGAEAKQQAQNGPGIAGVSKGPRRAVEQDQSAPVKAEIRKANTVQFNDTQPITYQARQNAQEVTMRRMDSGLAATMDSKTTMTVDPHKPTGQKSAGVDLLDLVEHQLQNGAAGMNWNPNSGVAGGFSQTMDMIYAALGAQNLMAVSPYREAGWDEKRLEQKENSQDVTIAPSAPEVKTPAPELNLERAPQINLGPGGM